jgi:hypothetical protein
MLRSQVLSLGFDFGGRSSRARWWQEASAELREQNRSRLNQIEDDTKAQP